MCKFLFCGTALCLVAPVVLAQNPAPKSAPAPKTAVARTVAALETSRILPDGEAVVTRIDRTAPRVSISLLVRAGAADEISETAGWRRLLTDAMLRAAKNDASKSDADKWLSAAQMQTEAEKIGGRLSASVGDDAIEFSISGSSSELVSLLNLLSNLALEPRLSDADIDGARRGLLRRLDDDSSDIAARATTELHARLYRDARGESVAYGLPAGGTLQSLNNLTGERVRVLHRAFFVPSHRVLSIAGDVDLVALKTWTDARDAGESAAPPALPTPFLAPPDSTQPPLIVRQLNTPAAWVFVAYATGSGNSARPADWPALQVLAAALGQSPRGRLPKKLLDNRLTASATAPAAERLVVEFSPRRLRGEFVMFAQTGPQQIEGVKNVLLDAVKQLQNAPLPASELQNAKNFARGTYATDRESLHERAYQSALSIALTQGSQTTPLLDNAWPQRLQNVSAKDVQEAARKYLQNYAVALILPSE